MDPEPEIKGEIKEEITEAIEMVNCDMDLNEFDFGENPVKEDLDNLDINDVQLSDSPSYITKSCPNELLVYTTRLDDMQIWWSNLDAMYVEEVTENIIKESKPKYAGHYENTKHNDEHRRTFSSLKDKIEEINLLPSHTHVDSIHEKNYRMPPSKRSKDKIEEINLLPSHTLVESIHEKNDRMPLSKKSKDKIEEINLLPSHTRHTLVESINEKNDRMPLSKRSKDKFEEINLLNSHTVVESIHEKSDPMPLSKRSKALLRACKPLSIVLRDCMKNEKYVRIGEYSYLPEENINSPPEFVTGDIKLSQKHEEDDISRNIRDNITRNMANNKPYYVIFKDLHSKDSAVYFIDDDVNPTEYYKLNNKNKRRHYIDSKSIVTELEIESCCWYKRQQRIKELSTAVSFRSNFLRTQHTCAPGLCKCCCKKIRNTVQTTSVHYNQPSVRVPKRAKTSYALPQNSTWQDDLLFRCQQSGSKWIDNALKYKVKQQHKDHHKKCEKFKNNGNTILQVEYVFVDGKKSSFYNINSPDVTVKTFIELSGPLSFTEKALPLYINSWDTRSSSHACCWCRYNMFLSELTNSFPPSVVKFMRKPHKCAPRKCVCCCKLKAAFTEKMPMKLVPVVFPSHLKYASNYCKKIQQRPSKPINTPNLYTPTYDVVVSSNITQTVSKVTEQHSVTLPAVRKTVTTDKTPTVSKITEWPSMTKPAALEANTRNVMPTNNKIIERLLVTPPPPTVSKIDSRNITPTTSNIIDRPKTSAAVLRTDSQIKPSDYILDRVLNELQGLSIVLHSDNTVTADLEDTPDNLSTENLKILKLLLERASIFMKNRKFTSTAPMRISNIFSSAKKSVGVLEFPTIILDDDDDPPDGDNSSSSAVSHSNNMSKTTQISQTIPSQQPAPESQLLTGFNATQFQDQFLKNIEYEMLQSTSPANQPEFSPALLDQYALCTKILYDKSVQYNNSILSLLNSRNENLSLNLKVPITKVTEFEDLASCLVDFQCFGNKPNQPESGQKRKMFDQNLMTTEKKIKMESNIAAVTSPINTTQVSQLPFRPITLPSGVNQIPNVQGKLPADSQTITLIPVTFVDPQSGQTIAKIPLSILNKSVAGNATDMVLQPIDITQPVQSIGALQNAVIIPPTPVSNQTQTGNDSAEANKNLILSRLLAEKTDSNFSEPRLISVESENNIVTGFIRKEDSDEDVSILGV